MNFFCLSNYFWGVQKEAFDCVPKVMVHPIPWKCTSNVKISFSRISAFIGFNFKRLDFWTRSLGLFLTNLAKFHVGWCPRSVALHSIITYEFFLFRGQKKRKDAMCFFYLKTTFLLWEFRFLKCLPFAHPKICIRMYSPNTLWNLCKNTC